MTRSKPPGRAPDNMLRRVSGILVQLALVESLLVMGVLAVVLSALEWLGTVPGDLTGLGRMAARVLWWVFFYLVAHKASRGEPGLPAPPDYRDAMDALIRPLIAGAFATCWYWLLLLGVAVARGGVVEHLARTQASAQIFLHQQGPWGYGLLAVGLLYLPVATLSALVGAPRLHHQLDPLRGFRLIWRVPGAFSVTFAVLTFLSVVSFALEVLNLRLVDVLPIPLAGPVIRHLMRLWVPLAQALLLGGFVHHNRPFIKVRGGH